jgi:hypothetical protein
MSNRDISYAKLLTEDNSFQLVRTNPKLTGNVKITINDAGEMWLESIKVNPELSKDLYSKVTIDPKQSHAANLFRFFNSGSTPNEIIFDLSEQVDSTKTSKDFKDQYDFSHYFSGVKYLASKKYSERMSYSAPIYLKKDVPDYFIIFKINDPANFPLDQLKQKYEAGESKTDYLIDLFNKASLIKTFDLRGTTTSGKYLRDYLASPNFPSSPLTVSYGENDFTLWNGILINEGTFGSRGELLNDLYTASTPLKFFEEQITNGFSRNGIIFPNILNLEFVFNDDSSTQYDFNRYVGLYVNAIELTQLDIDLNRAYLNRKTWENTPYFRKNFLETDEVVLSQNNLDGVIIPFKNSTINFSEFKDTFSNSENMFINYINDKDSNLYTPKLDDAFKIEYSEAREVSLTSVSTLVNATLTSHGYLTDDLIVIASTDSEYTGEFLITRIDSDTFEFNLPNTPTNPSAIGSSKKELKTGELRFANTKIDLGLFFGPSRNTFLQDIGNGTNVAGHSYGVIKIESDLTNYDEIRIYHPNGTLTDSFGRHELITSTQGYSLIPNAGEYYAYNDYDGVLGNDEFYMNGGGTPSQIASALVGCINNIRNRTFTAFQYDDRVFIKLNSAGDFDNLYKISFTSPASDYSVVTINDTNTGALLIGSQFTFTGGSKEKGNRLIIDAGHLSKINQNIDSILIKSSNNWSKIRKVSQYIDEITEGNSITQSLRSQTLANYDGKIAIVLEENESPTILNREFLMKLKFKPSFGLLSFYSVKDLDFDFYSSTYTNFPNIDLYQYYFIPENTTLLAPGVDYIVYNGTINVDNGTVLGVEYSANDTFTVSTQTKYSIVSGTPLVTYDPNTTSTIIPINDSDGALKDFSGFSILKDPTKVIPQDSTIEYLYKTRYLNGLTETEYDFYKENESLDFALRSKIIPYITKWGIKNGKDCRDNQYRLNTEIVFGKNNFSPNHDDRSQNPVNFTHEWFYIQSKFNYVNDESTLAQNTNYFETPFDEDLLKSDPNYFINYFTYTPTSQLGKEVADTQFRYSSIFKNSAGKYEAFFKGFKISFNDVLDSLVLGADGKPLTKDTSTRFDDYKFSCLLIPIKEGINDQTQQPIKYRVIEHKGEGYKFILLIIEVALGSELSINAYWKSGSPAIVDTSNFRNEITLGSGVPLFDTINGDYRVSFDGNNVSNLTNTLLYSLKNKKYNTLAGAYSNTKMASKLNISTGISPNMTIERLENKFIPNYPAILTDDIIKPTNLTNIFIKDLSTGFDLFIDSVSTSYVPLDPIINTIDFAAEQYVHFNDILGLITLPTPLTNPLVLYGILPTGVLSIIDESYVFKVLTGGENYYERLFEKLSFAKFKKYVNELNPIIEYTSYTLDSNGLTITEAVPNFYLDIPDVSVIEKVSQVITNNTASIPVQFSGQIDIGTDYEVGNLQVPYEVNRYRGEYEPLVKNYSIYQSNYVFSKNPINDLSLSNVKLNTDISQLFTIQNFNHIKVADSKILVLESDDAYLPRYPKINEVAIGQADYFLLQGNWDWGFHYKYLDKSTYLPVSGARRVEEDDSFIAKLITLPEVIELENFIIGTQLAADQEFNTIDLSKIEIVYRETPLAIEGVINVVNVLTRYLIEDGFSEKFNEYLVNSSEFIGNFNSISDTDVNVSSYVREYIRLNILKLYDIETNEFYVKEDASIISANPQANSNPNSISFVSLTDKQRFTQGYNILKSLQINKKDKLMLKFNFAKKQGSGLSISPKIKIKFI